MSTPISSNPNQANETIVRRINEIRRQVKRVEWITTLAALATFLLAFLLCSVVLDHWVFKEGTPSPLRWVMILGFLLVGVLFFIWKLIPILRFSVNPAYAAEVLERCHPDMKNRLVNWVFLKREKRSQGNNPLRQHILDGMSRETAANLTQIQTELVVDHRQAFRWGFGCILLLATFFLYTVFSPKNPIDSIIRTVNPLSAIAAPQSLAIKDVLPGDLTVFQGTFTEITARLDRPTKLPVHVVYSTRDGKLIDQRVPMNPKGDGYHFETRFPPGKTGFQETLVYRIEAGESRSQSWDITVRPAIYVQPEKLEYRYPEYTGLVPETIENGGDISVLEGTYVTLHARSNIEMDRAEILFDGKSDQAESMTIPASDRTRASVGFSLLFDPETPENQRFSSYTLKCRDKESNPNPSPMSYAVKVIRDLAPTAHWLDESNLPTEVPINAKLDFQVEAEDPDFGLRHVRLVANKVETAAENADLVTTSLPQVELLEKPTAGKVVLKGSIVPARLKLKPGDRVDYYVETVDVKLPQPNQTNSSVKSFIVTDPVDTPAADNPQQNQGQQGDQENQNGNNAGEQDSDNQEGSQGGNQNENQGDEQGDEQEQGDDQGEQNHQGDQQSGDQNQQEGDSGSQPGGEGETGKPSNPQQNPSGDDTSGDQTDTNGNESGDEKPAESQPRPQPQNRDKPVDGESNPGDVFRETLERMKEKGLDPEKTLKPQPDHKTNDDPELAEDDPRLTDGEKTDRGTPPKQRPQQGEDDRDRSPSDAFSAKEGQNPDAQKFDPANNDKPIYRDPDDPGEKSSGKGEPDVSADELNMDQKPQGGTPGENPPEGNAVSQNGDRNQDGNQKGDGTTESTGDTPGRANPDSGRSDSNGSDSGNPPQPGAGSRSRNLPQDQDESAGGAMDPNLEYTEKATSLAIDYLEDELGKREPDPDLLDRLRWSKQDLEKFVSRWKQMRENANRIDRSAQDSKQWEETLKNIGRLAPRTTVGTRDAASRVQSTATESHRFAPPQKLRDRAEAYTQGLGSQK